MPHSSCFVAVYCLKAISATYFCCAALCTASGGLCGCTAASTAAGLGGVLVWVAVGSSKSAAACFTHLYTKHTKQQTSVGASGQHNGCRKPNYFALSCVQNRATFVLRKSVARFRAASTVKWWPGLELNQRHKDFQNTCSSKNPYLQCLQRVFVIRATDRATAKPHKLVARFYVTTTPLFCKWGGIGKKSPPQKFQLGAKNPQPKFLWAADPFLYCVYKTYKLPTTHTNHCSIASRAHSQCFCSSCVFGQIPRVLTLYTQLLWCQWLLCCWQLCGCGAC